MTDTTVFTTRTPAYSDKLFNLLTVAVHVYWWARLVFHSGASHMLYALLPYHLFIDDFGNF